MNDFIRSTWTRFRTSYIIRHVYITYTVENKSPFLVLCICTTTMHKLKKNLKDNNEI